MRENTDQKNFKYGYFLRSVNISSEVYSEPCQICKMECFAKVINSLNPLNIFTNRFILYGVVVVSLLLTLNIFHILFLCFYC